MSRRAAGPTWGGESPTAVLVAHNVSTRYVAYLVDGAIGFVLLPFNLAHLGMAAYGLWMLTTSMTVYLSLLDMGYGGALVRFVAQYRARRDAQALNEVISTLFVVYTAIGAAAYAIVLLIAFNLDLIAALTPDQAATSRTLLLIIGTNVALRFVFGVFGGVVVGFQQYKLNNLTSIAASLTVALVNVLVLLAGHGVVALVAATTVVRLLALGVYRLNAYRVFPGLELRWGLVRLQRLREVSEFSVFMLMLDSAYKLNYSSDVLVIAAFIGAPAVALWVPAQRLVDLALRLSNQLNEALFPVVVDCNAARRHERLRRVFVQGTCLSLATVLPIGGGLALLADPLVMAWIGPSFAGTATVAQILAVVVILRVGTSTASIVLKGAGLHRTLTGLISLTAVANVIVSIALIRSMGLVGVALGTLVPVAAVSLFAIFPTACRHLGLSVGHVLRKALWPALWPAAIAGALLVVTRSQAPATLPAIALQLALGGAVYFGLFLGAIGATERREYLRKARELLPRPRFGVAA